MRTTAGRHFGAGPLVLTFALTFALAGATGAVGGSAADARGTGVVPAATTTGPYAWATADQPSNPGPYSPSTARQFNSTTTASALVTRSAVGKYRVFFPGMQAHAAGSEGASGTAFVSNNRCKTTGWTFGTSGVTVSVACYRLPGTLNQGQPTDSEFSVGFTNRSAPSLLYPVVFARTSQPTLTTTYTPPVGYRFNFGNPVRVLRTALGRYTVTFASIAATGMPKITAFGSDNAQCNISSWAASSADTKIKVACWDGTGALADSKFVLQYAVRNSLYGEGSLFDAGITNVSPGVNWSFRSGFLPPSDSSVTAGFPGTYSVTLRNQSPNLHASVHISTVGGPGRSCSVSAPDMTVPGDLVFSIACFSGTTLTPTGWVLEFNGTNTP